jgi:hypothetical protein
MVVIVLNRRTVNMDKPYWADNPPFMGHDLNETLMDFKKFGRGITKITIEVDKLTQIEYFIVPGRWIDRLYDSEFLRRGTL